MRPVTLGGLRLGWRNPAGWAFVFALGACSSSSDSTDARKGDSPNDDEAPAPHMQVAANVEAVHAPLDATPSPDGTRVYYTALQKSADGDVPGVFRVDANGGSEPEMLASGGPITAPVGLAISRDGKRLFLADPASGDKAGAILVLSVDGGAVSVLESTAGYAPAGITIGGAQNRERVYFTGRDPSTGRAGLYEVALAGGAVSAVADGDAFVEPTGVAVSDDGDAYVVDGGAGGRARVLRVHDGKAESWLDQLGVGFPAGITLTLDARTVLISGVDPETRHDVVYFANAETRAVSRLTKTVGAFSEAAGLHRAHDKDVFAWADTAANASGTVYVLTP